MAILLGFKAFSTAWCTTCRQLAKRQQCMVSSSNDGGNALSRYGAAAAAAEGAAHIHHFRHGTACTDYTNSTTA